MRIAKLYLLPALLLIATVKIDIVAAQVSWAQFQSLKGQGNTTPCPPVVTHTYTSSVDDPDPDPEPEPTNTTPPDDEDLYPTYDLTSPDPTYRTLPRSFEADYEALSVNSIGRNAELNTINGTDSARNRQTIVIRQPARRGSQRRRRRPNRRRPSTEKRRRRNRHNSKDRRRRRRGGQRKGPRQAVRRVFVRRHYTNRRSLGESTAKNEQPQ